MSTSKKNNILFIGSFLSKKRGSKGPTEFIAEELAINGFSVTLASTQNNKYLRLIDTVVKLLFFSGSTVSIDVYSGTAFNIAEIAVGIARLKKHKLILNLHGGKLPEFLLHNKNRVKKLFEKVDQIYSPSKFIIEAFKQLNYPITYIPNPINLNNFSYDRTNVTPFSLLWVRAFTDIYNPEIALLVLDELRQKWPNTTLTMVGPDLGKLSATRALCERLNLIDHVTFTGPVLNSELKKYYQTHAVYINTTSYESFGVALVEAAACGIPIVSNKVGEIPLIWNEKENILMVNDNAIKEYANKIEQLFTNPALCEMLSTNAQRHTLKYNKEEIIKQWITIYNTN